MTERTLLLVTGVAISVLGARSTDASAQSIKGFAGADRSYLVGSDRVCQSLNVVDGKASGVPQCQTLSADKVAKLDFAPGSNELGSASKLTATASGTTLTIADDGAVIVTWEAPEKIGKVVAAQRATYGDRIAVAYQVRRMGRDVVDVVGFDLLQKRSSDPIKPPEQTPPEQTSPAVVVPPALTKALAKARAAKGKKAKDAWAAVVRDFPGFGEGYFGSAKAAIASKDSAGALGHLQALSQSQANDAIEWLVAARFDKAFAGLRADAGFRKSVGLDRKSSTVYERVMGFGGGWEQTGTSCDSPTVALNLTQARAFALTVKTSCEGMNATSRFKGRWSADAARNQVVLIMPNPGKPDDIMRCSFVAKGDEEALSCPVAADLVVVVLPVRR